MKDLSTLNLAQRQAVEALTGPVLVLAGPGTGKTHLLTTRIAHLLDAGVGAEAHNILCLTFTDAGAVEMRDRLQRWIGNEAYKVKITTFHGFCEWVMMEYPQYFTHNRGSRTVADDLQKALAFRTAIQSRKWKYFANVWNDFFFKNDLSRMISDLKKEDITPASLRELLPDEREYLEERPENFYQKKYRDFNPGDFKPAAREAIDQKLAKMAELADLWEVYESQLSADGCFDFDDQILWVLQALSQYETLKFDLQERFQWVMVDEYQDTNATQNAILWALTDYDDAPNLFAVGDDDQAIYRFQGASVENIFEFQQRFTSHHQITLSENYRSAQNILDGAFESVAYNADRVDESKHLIASGVNTAYAGTITKSVFGSRYLELSFLVKQIRCQIEQGIRPNEIAILVRKNAEVLEIARELPKFGIPVAANVFQNIFENEFVKILIQMLEIFQGPEKDHVLIELLHAPFWEIESVKLLQFSIDLYKRKDLTAIEFLIEKSVEDTDLQKILHLVVTTRKNYHHCRPGVIAEKLLYESGMAQYITQLSEEESLIAWQNIRKFLDWTRDQSTCETLNALLERIRLHQELQIAVRPDPLPADKSSVQIMTVHKSKGREFDIVFIPGLLDSVWGNPRSMSLVPVPHIFKKEFNENDDERRLFFVAMTRSRKELYLSYSEKSMSGKDKNASIFWYEVSDERCQSLAREEVEMSLQKILPVFLSAGKDIHLLPEEKHQINETVKRFVWSATSLQSFLDCPRRFLYQSLYKFPRKPQPQMTLGTSLHEALEKYMREFHQTRILPDKQLLLDLFDRSLRGQNIEWETFQKLLEHGKEILSQYFEYRRDTWTPDLLIEFNFDKFVPEIEGIRITGKMDKIVFLDADKTRAKIVDYKSGRGKPIKKGEKYWRQLVFYDLLAHHSKGITWIPESCELEFLTPDATGKFTTQSYVVTLEDRDIVIAELKEAHQKLQNFEFPLVENPNNDPDIDFWQNFGHHKHS